MPTLKHVFVMAALALLSVSNVHAERRKLGDLPEEVKKNPQQELQIIDADVDVSTAAEKPLEDNVAEEFYQKGLKALNEGRLEQAEGFFDRVLVIKPNHKGAQEGIAYIMQTLEDPKPPAPPVKTDPKIELLQKLQAKLEDQIAKENWEEAHAVAAKMLAIDPNHAAAKSKLTLIKQKLHDAAVERAQEQEAQGDYAGAIDAYRNAQSYRTDPMIPEIITGLRKKIAEQKEKKSEALYLEALQKSQDGKTDEAIALCKQALAANPDNFQAQRMLDRLQPRPAK
jgi:tetratricopeptide (TPR) repeat protein